MPSVYRSLEPLKQKIVRRLKQLVRKMLLRKAFNNDENFRSIFTPSNSLQTNMEKLYTVSKNKTRSSLWLRS